MAASLELRMKNWTIRTRLIVSVALILALIVAMGSLSTVRLLRVQAAGEHLAKDSLPGLLYSGDLALAWSADYILIERYELVEERAAKEEMLFELEAHRSKLNELITRYETTIFAAENRQLFERLKGLLPAYLQLRQQLLQQSDNRLAAEQVGSLGAQLDAQFKRIAQTLQEVREYDRRGAQASAQNIMVEVASAKTNIIAGVVSVLILSAVLGYFLLRSVTQPLQRLLSTTDVVSKGDFTQRIELDRRDEFGALAGAFDRMVAELSGLIDHVQRSAIQVGTSVTEIVATTNEQQATATEIAATTTEIGATSKEISANSKELVGTMHEVSAVAEQTAGLASNGQAALARMESTMQHITEAATSINAKLVVLNEKASNINQVVTTITKVADQTNLLSLNAAIEAEKAGEAGRGFAVVATEIRRLADQTSVATYDIEQTVKEIQSAVTAGVMGMDKFSDEVRRGKQDIQEVGNQLSQIIQQVQTLVPRIVAASEGMQAQSTGAEQISDALAQLTDASQQTVTSLRQSNEAVSGLNSVANALRGAIARFKLRVQSQSVAA
jgi:methyl-accepting chemotaxis protein WspA